MMTILTMMITLMVADQAVVDQEEDQLLVLERDQEGDQERDQVCFI